MGTLPCPVKSPGVYVAGVATVAALSIAAARALRYFRRGIEGNSLRADGSEPPQGRAEFGVKRRKDTGRTNVFTVCLTGGPCGGKSSALKTFSAALTKANVKVFTVPEVPTILLKGGCRYPGEDVSVREQLLAFETALMDLQLQIEDSFIQIANSLEGQTSVVVMDRGLLDIAAYMPKELWEQVLARIGVTENQLAARYDLVLHLTTAADGAEQFYTCANNDARTETPEQARALDKRIRSCWQRAVSSAGLEGPSHTRIAVVDNGGATFHAKCDSARDAVMSLMQ